VLVGLGEQFDAMPLERADNPIPDFTTDVTVAALFGDGQGSADFEAMHSAQGDAGSLGQLNDG
jgi:hypothetical protein